MKNIFLIGALFNFSILSAEIDSLSKTLIVEEGTSVISSNSFKGKKNFNHIKFPSSLERIGKNAFQGCDSLEEVRIPKGVFVEEEAFLGCKSLRNVVIEDDVKIDMRAFRYCTAIDTIILAENDSLGYGVFEDINPIKRLEIPRSTYVDMWGIPSDTTYYWGKEEDLFNKLNYFYKGTVLYVDGKKMGHNLVIPDYVSEMSYKQLCALKEVFSTITVNPQTLKKVENECKIDTLNYLGTLSQYNQQPIKAEVVLFNGTQLGGVVPEGVDSLGFDASRVLIYDDTKKSIVRLPSSLKYIREVVGYKDSVLNIISFAEQPPVLYNNYFMEEFDVHLYVPCQSVYAYQNDSKWSAAKTIKCLSDTTEIPEPVVPHLHDFTYGDCVCGEIDSLEQHWFDITNVDELYEFAELVKDGHKWLNGRLLSDLVLNDTIIHREVDYRENEIYGDTSLKLWNPIATYSAIFDGENHTIKGVYSEERVFLGFFSLIENGTVKNLTLEDVFIFNNSEGMAGIISGYAENSHIENCHVSGFVGCVYGNAAGIVGDASNCTIKNCSNSADVYGQGLVAGIANANNPFHKEIACLSISRCWNKGYISGNKYTQSIAGIASSHDGYLYVRDSYNMGTVESVAPFNENYGAGGICGGKMKNVWISDCYNVGNVVSKGLMGLIAPTTYNNVKNVITHGDSAVFGHDSLYIHNCYALIDDLEVPQRDSLITELHYVTDDQFKSGEICYSLNHGVTNDSPTYYQNLNDSIMDIIDKYPVLDSTHKIVYYDDVLYYNEKDPEISDVKLSGNNNVVIYYTEQGITVENAVGNVKLVDMKGKVLFSHQIESSESVCVPIGDKGVYLLSVGSSIYKVIAH